MEFRSANNWSCCAVRTECNKVRRCTSVHRTNIRFVYLQSQWITEMWMIVHQDFWYFFLSVVSFHDLFIIKYWFDSIWIVRVWTIIEKVIKTVWMIHSFHPIDGQWCVYMWIPSIQLIDMKCNQSRTSNFEFWSVFDWMEQTAFNRNLCLSGSNKSYRW